MTYLKLAHHDGIKPLCRRDVQFSAMAIKFIETLAIICTLQIIVSIASSKEDDQFSETIKNDCKHKLDFKTIRQFREFIISYKQLEVNAGLDIQKDPVLKRCFADKDSLYALDELISQYDRKRPCKFQEIAKLENFARKYLLGNRKSLALKFFTLFGLNIGFRCKLNLLAHLRQADMEADQVDFIYSMASPTGWNALINDHTKKSMKFGTSSYAEANVINRVAKLIPGFDQIDQLDYMSFDHAFDKVPFGDRNRIESFSYQLGDIQTASKLKEYLNKIIQSCQNLDQLYVNSVLSLARLNELGLLIESKLIDEQHGRSITLHKWLAAASFCQLMVRVSVELVGEDIQVHVFHDDSLVVSRRKLYSYVAEFEEINKEVAADAWKASILDAPWAQKNQAMFSPDEDGKTSLATKQLKQFIKGLEHDYKESLNEN